MELGGEFQVPPLLHETQHAHLPGIPLFVAAFIGEGISLDVSMTHLCQYIELCTSAGNGRSLQFSYTDL